MPGAISAAGLDWAAEAHARCDNGALRCGALCAAQTRADEKRRTPVDIPREQTQAIIDAHRAAAGAMMMRTDFLIR